MKQKKRYLLPLIALLTLLMAGSASAKPRLSAKTVTFSPVGYVFYSNSGYQMGISYEPTSQIYLLGGNKDAFIPADVLSTKEYVFNFYYGGRVRNGKLPLAISMSRLPHQYSDSSFGGAIYESPYEPNKTYTKKIRVYNDINYEKYSSVTLKVRIRNDLAKTISYLKISNKKFTAPFRSSKSRGVIDLKGVPTGKKVKVTFKATGKLKNAKYFYILRTKKTYKNGSKVTLKKGDVLMIGGKLDKNGTATGSVPIVINVDHTKYKTN